MTTSLQPSLPGDSPFSSSPILSSACPDLSSLKHLSYQDPSTKCRYIHAEYEDDSITSSLSSAPSSPQITHSTYSTPGSSVSLDLGYTEKDNDTDDYRFPAFEAELTPQDERLEYLDEEQADLQTALGSPSKSTPSPKGVNDDQAVEPEPQRHVDFLSHDWREEDIWSSWRYVVKRRKTIGNSIRLENAAWRTWMKAKYELKTVSPETLNWLKDCDVTWLYGPLQIETKKSMTGSHSPPPNLLSHSSSFCKKPILKKKSASAAILERSRSQHSLLQRAGEIIRVQQSSPAHGRPAYRRGAADFALPSYTPSSVANTPAEHDTPGCTGPRPSFGFYDPPTPSDSKHVLFNEEVRQVRAIESDEDDNQLEEQEEVFSESDEDDDGGLMMLPTRTRSNRSTPRNSFSDNNKTIAPLPSTTLKYRTDTPELPGQANVSNGPWSQGGNRKLSPSPSQETLRPSRPSQNFLIDDDPEVMDEPWIQQAGSGSYSPYEEDEDENPRMRRTESGMFMPYDENDEPVSNNGLIGQAMYAVNTFRDIAHVVWNVGWNRK